MANVKGGIMAAQKEKAPAGVNNTLAGLIKLPSVQARFNDYLKENTGAFLSSLLSITNNNKLLATAEPKSVLGAALQAASYKLPINPNLGFAWIIPFKDKGMPKAQFILGARAWVQLALRSNKIKSLTAEPVAEGEIINFNRFAETYETGPRISNKIVGYFARFETKDGYAKAIYWSVDDVKRHAERNSKSYKSPSSPWHTGHFDAMAIKTVLAYLLKHWAPLSIDEWHEMAADESIKEIDIETGETIDIFPAEESDGLAVDVETGEILKAE